MNPSVSVIIPTYNRAPLLREALESVLRQTYAPREILIVDDGSTDDTRAISRAHDDTVRYFFQNNRGPAAARNVGIQNARGDVIAFLDDDDLWVPEALEWRVARLQDARAPAVQVVLGLTQPIPQGEPNISSQMDMPPWAANLFGCALLTRAVFVRVGMLDETLRYGEDMDWFLRVREQNIPYVFLEQATLLYRAHPKRLMSDMDTANRYRLQVLKKSLARRARSAVGIQPLPEIPALERLQKIVQRVKL